MQALSLSLSPAGSGDKKVEFPSAPAEDEKARLRSPDNKETQTDFSDSFEAASSNTEKDADISNTDPIKTSDRDVITETPKIETNKDDTVLVAAIASNENRETAILTSKGSTSSSPGHLSTGSDVSTSQQVETSAKAANTILVDSKITVTNQDDADLPSKVLADKEAKTTFGLTGTNSNITSSNAALEGQGAKPKDVSPQTDVDIPKDQKLAHKIAEKDTPNLQALKTKGRDTPAADLRRSQKSATIPSSTISDVDTSSALKEPTNLVEADSIDDVLKKRAEFKAFGQMNFSGQATQNLSHSLLPQTTAVAEGNLAITTSMTSPTLSTSIAPAAQIVMANPAAIVTNFNAVSQAMLVANETAKGVAVQLDPPEMGRVYIDFIFNSDDSVNVVVKSELPESHLLLRDRSEQFLEFLKESGLENVNLSFEQGSDQNESDFDNEDTPKPLYMAALTDDPTPLPSTLRYAPTDVQSFDGLDLRL
ncbi:flagellar hook-length control protein FliK [Litorimonas haliclonae]|uniref:flagellar hook-length control protein FliK n=1 Tax=Litorimonas haliclonae TaxID=2081977 RepID=UPI0039EFA684